MRIYVEARLHELHTPNDCHREARRLVPEALRAIGEIQARDYLTGHLTHLEHVFLIRAAGRRFASRANARFKRQLEQKLFDRLWWSRSFPRLARDTDRLHLRLG